MSETEIAIPPQARERLRIVVNQMLKMQQEINLYFQGIIDSLGLEGEWDLDVKRMVAVKRQEPEPKPELEP